MNQDNNGFNQNNFNTQGNNGIPNNQPLNNQSFNQGMGVNPQPINPQPQPTTSFQQPIMQEPTPQPMNTFESGNTNNHSFNSKPPKKMNLGLIIGIVVAIAVVIVGIVFGSKLLSNDVDSNQNNNNNSSETDNNSNVSNNKYEKDKDLPGDMGGYYDNVTYCIDGPNNQVFNRGFLFSRGHYDSELGHVDSYFVVTDNYLEPASKLIYDVKIEEIKTASDILVGMKNQIISALKFGHITAARYDYKITNQKEVKINGYDMVRFEGIFYLLYDVENPAVDYTEAKFVGYSLMKDGVPVYFIVSEKPNQKNPIDIGQLADKMAKTFRENDGDCYDD